jgi:hypothetical protein
MTGLSLVMFSAARLLLSRAGSVIAESIVAEARRVVLGGEDCSTGGHIGHFHESRTLGFLRVRAGRRERESNQSEHCDPA